MPIVFTPLLIPFVTLALFIVILALTDRAKDIIRVLFNASAVGVIWIPGVGRLVRSSADAVASRLTRVLSDSVTGTRVKVAVFFHSLGQLVAQTAREIERHAQLIYILATAIPGVGVIAGIWRAIDVLRRALHVTSATVRPITKTITVTIPAKLGAATHTLAARVAALSAAVGGAIAVDIPNLWHRERVLTDQLARLWKWTRAHGRTLGEVAGVGAVAVALARLGFRWLTCRNVGRVGRQVCATDADILDQLLLDGLAIFGVLSVVEFAKVMRDIEGAAVDLIGGMVREWP